MGAGNAHEQQRDVTETCRCLACAQTEPLSALTSTTRADPPTPSRQLLLFPSSLTSALQLRACQHRACLWTAASLFACPPPPAPPQLPSSSPQLHPSFTPAPCKLPASSPPSSPRPAPRQLARRAAKASETQGRSQRCLSDARQKLRQWTGGRGCEDPMDGTALCQSPNLIVITLGLIEGRTF